MKTIQEEKQQIEDLTNRSETRTKVDDDYVEQIIKEGFNFEPHADMMLYIMTYEVRDDEYKGLHVPDVLFLGDKEEGITKQKMWLLKKGPETKNTTHLELGTRILVRGNAMRINVRMNEGTENEEELFLFAVRDYDIIGHFTK